MTNESSGKKVNNDCISFVSNSGDNATDRRKIMILHCKPTYKFQSIEFDYDTDCESGFNGMESAYVECLKRLMKIAPDQDQPVKGPSKPKQEMATVKQLNLMDNLGIKHPANCSKVMAKKLISEFMSQSEE
ncbi:MAG: hypothetical protein IKB64_10115 [Paludibacteraceae bacterium]|nr:hypothetical protein [Paludibacteraceae bacterium]